MSVLPSPLTQQEPGNYPHRSSDARSSMPAHVRPTWLDRWARRAVLERLRSLSDGQLHFEEKVTTHLFGDKHAEEVAHVEVCDPRFYREIALGSSLGAGDAFVKGYWRSNDLLAVMRLFAKNLDQKNDLQVVRSPSHLLRRQLLRWSNRNSRKGSQRNIHRHYNLSNDLFALFLDPTMTYSCGIFPTEEATLESASLEKYERICRQLKLQEDDHVVEIGCGWGGFAQYAARRYGCRVTGITISKQQLVFAQKRIVRAGLEERVQLRFCDYRDLEGDFDKLVSIEMIEAVGHEYFDTFFQRCSSLLRPGGQMLLQAITIPDDRYDYYRRTVDFIQKYIFPGGCLPSLAVIRSAVDRVTDMQIQKIDDFAADYARTLLAWRNAFFLAEAEIDRLGFDETFRRTWDYYFCYCTAGFLEQQIGVAQILLERPQGSLQ